MTTLYNDYFQAVIHLLFLGVLGTYLILNLQWYSYRLERVLFHHKKQRWHLTFLLVPLIAYYLTGKYFWIFLLFAQIPMFALWYRKMDKKLVLTARVKRFYLFLLLGALTEQVFCFGRCEFYSVLVPLIAASALSILSETVILNYYRANAKAKLAATRPAPSLFRIAPEHPIDTRNDPALNVTTSNSDRDDMRARITLVLSPVQDHD